MHDGKGMGLNLGSPGPKEGSFAEEGRHREQWCGLLLQALNSCSKHRECLRAGWSLGPFSSKQHSRRLDKGTEQTANLLIGNVVLGLSGRRLAGRSRPVLPRWQLPPPWAQELWLAAECAAKSLWWAVSPAHGKLASWILPSLGAGKH